MSKIKILVVDDEQLARERICRFLKNTQSLVEIEIAENGLQALGKINSFFPQIIFLDIQMPGLTGFDVLQNLENRNFKIIFQTAYDQFALKAFEENAVDYLLKPFTEKRFYQAWEKALNLVQTQRQLEGLNNNLIEEKLYLQNIYIKQANKTKIINVSEIHYFDSKDHYTYLYTQDQEYICDLSLNWLERNLSPKEFIRTHRSCIVKISHIHSIGPTTDYLLELKNKIQIPLSRSARPRLLKMLGF